MAARAKAGRDDEALQAPTGTTLWCFPACKDVCTCCSGCYDCCGKCGCCPGCCNCGPPCPGCYYCLPCVCCCCRPAMSGLRLDEEELVTEPTLADVGAPEEGEEQLAGEDIEGGEEEEEQPPEESQPLQDGEKAARPKIATRKRAPAQVKKRAAKSQPKLFTGSAAGSPPPPAEACIGPPPEAGETSTELGEGVYLIYNTDQGGSLFMKWSKEPLKGPGVLAYIRPSKEVGDFKFQKKGGVEMLCTGLEKDMQSSFVADRKKFYEGWASFLKQMDAWEGSLVLLPAAALQPPPKVKVVMLSQKKVGRSPERYLPTSTVSGGRMVAAYVTLRVSTLGVEAPITKANADMLAVVADNTTKLDVPTMEPSEFVAVANNFGTSVSFAPAKH
ncbi:hypothetical protein CSUI_008030 [Cystoisospora suis]|uniref:Immune mapped protein 2 N-terminal domain-containing protein n=1 Tax=Cystoisospora suis TaxID=483139 RepID=A0A2C6KNU0_9APIC|nr:hypothetical protein CSUI_008030 [Cystoisospora suis]